MKRYFSFLILFFLVSNVSAQTDTTDLPIDPLIRTGKLSNGMSYYIRSNKQPENRAELRLAVNAGSICEKDEQQGLAHLVEHMAFNGSAHFKKNELIDYLESVGTKFGPHLNAYTSFDETVYMLQIPTDKPGIVDTGLQILQDWSYALSFDSIEVEKERGVVIEEWRLGQGANERMRRKYFPLLFKDSRYADRLPIGKKEIIEKCPQSVLRSFYNDWYRTDLMAVIAVGDFDAGEMEAKIKKIFSAVPVQQGLGHVLYEVLNNKELIIATATDKETPRCRVEIIYKQPLAITRTEADYRKNLARDLFSSMVSSRLDEIKRQPDPPFIRASAGYGRFVRTTNAYSSEASCNEEDILSALQTLLTENERVRRYGFTASELERVKADLLRSYEKQFEERSKTESRNFASEYVNNFLTGEAIPGIESEYKLAIKMLPLISIEEVNSFSRQWITGAENCIVLITAPDKPGLTIPSDDIIRAQFKNSSSMDMEKYSDRVVDKPLLEKKLRPIAPISESTIDTFNISIWKYSNGVTVYAKQTDFKNDQILFTSGSWGGWSLYPVNDFMSASTADEIVDYSGVGEFDQVALEKKLSGKFVGVTPYISELQQGFNGSCSPRDLQTLMQLIYLYTTEPRMDSLSFLSYLTSRKGMIQNRSADPQSVFSDSVSYIMSGYSPFYRPLTPASLDSISLKRAIEIYKEQVGNAANETFFFVGNFNLDSLREFSSIYLANLPVSQRQRIFQDINVNPPAGKISKTIVKGEAPKSVVMLRWNMPFTYNRNNRNEVNALNKLLSIRLREVLREEKSGVYGVSCSSTPKHFPKERLEQTIYFSCNPDNADSLIAAALNVIEEVRQRGCDEKNLLKIRETAIRERETAMRENSFWLNTISSNFYNKENLTEILKYNEWLFSLKGNDFKSFADKYFKTENYARFVLVPEIKK
jgi:zinc protease